MLTWVKEAEQLQQAIERSRELALRRGVNPCKWIANAIEAKNELEAGQAINERSN